MIQRFLPLVLLSLAGAGCFQSHRATVRTAALPPPPDPVVRHSARLWIALEAGVGAAQCVSPEGSRPLCFEAVDAALARSLGRALWTSFPSVAVLGRGDAPYPGDYVLELDLRLEAVPPAAGGGPGWAALGRGRYRLLRDGKSLAAEELESLSRSEFGYGRPLGSAAGEVVDALAFHIGMTLGALPEDRPDRPVPLPPVQARNLASDEGPVAKR